MSCHSLLFSLFLLGVIIQILTVCPGKWWSYCVSQFLSHLLNSPLTRAYLKHMTWKQPERNCTFIKICADPRCPYFYFFGAVVPGFNCVLRDLSPRGTQEVCNTWFSLCSHYPLLSFRAIPWRNQMLLGITYFNQWQPVDSMWLVSSLKGGSPCRTVWVEHPSKTVLLHKAPVEAIRVPGCGRQWISRRGWRGQWQMAPGLLHHQQWRNL